MKYVSDLKPEIDYRNLGEDSSDLIIAFDSEFRYTYVNPQVERQIGIARETMIGRTIFEVAPHTAGTIYAVNYERALRDRVLVEFENYYPPLKRWNSVRCVPQPDGGVIVFARNTTEEHRVEEDRIAVQGRLEESLNLLSSVVNATSDMVAAIDLERRFLLANTALAAFMGFASPDAIIGHRDVDLLNDEASLPAMRLLKETDDEILQSGKSTTFEFTTEKSPNGDGPRTYLTSKAPLRHHATGEIVGLCSIAHDITERTRRESRDRFLARLSERTRSLLDPEEVVNEVVSSLGQFLSASRCAYLEVDVESGVINVQSEWLREGMLSVSTTVPLTAFSDTITEALRTGSDLVFADLEIASLTEYDRKYFRERNVRSLINVPIFSGDRWIGTLSVGDDHVREWNANEVSLVCTTAERSRLALENARLNRDAQKKAERDAYLAEVSKLLSSTLDYEATLATVAKLAVPDFADWCVVDLFREETQTFQPVAIAHVNPEKIELGWKLRKQFPPNAETDQGIFRVLSTGQSTFVPLVTDDVMRAGVRDEAYLEILLQMGFKSVMIVPLVVRNTVFGTLSLIATSESDHLFTEDDLRLAEDIGRRAGLAIDNSRLFQKVQREESRQRRIAETLQVSLMVDTSTLSFSRYEVDAHYEAALEESLVGGDFGDVFRVDEDRVAMLVGDCTGKGLAAARFVGECQFTARVFVRAHPLDPSWALSQINQMLIDDQRYDGRPIEALTTMVIAIVNTLTGETIVSSGGAEPPIILRSTSGKAEEVPVLGPLLGVDLDSSFPNVHVTLDYGDSLVIATDGITEARDAKTRAFLGNDGLSRIVEDTGERSTGICGQSKAILAKVKEFTGGTLSDDACIIVGRRKASD